MSRPITGLLLLLVLGAGCDDQATTRGSDAEPEVRDTPLESLLRAEGEILFAAGETLVAGLFALEDTHAAFIAAAPRNVWRNGWDSHLPWDLVRQLGAAERRAVLSAVAAHPRQRGGWDGFARSWRQWLLAWRQYEVFADLYHGEGVMAAAFAVPATRGLFDEALERRRLEPHATPPEQVLATLAAGEHAEILYRWVAAVAALGREEQAAYHRVTGLSMVT